MPRGEAPRAQSPRRPSGQRAMIVGGARHNGKCRVPDDVHPAPPARQLLQIVGAHQPDERGARKTPPQCAQRIVGETRRQMPFDVGGDHPRPKPARGRKPARARQPCRERGHAVFRLQRVARRHQQPDLLQPKPPHRRPHDIQMPGMCRIEAAAKEADPDRPRIAEPRQARFTNREWRGRRRNGVGLRGDGAQS